MIRRVLGAGLALLCVGVLSSCSLLPSGPSPLHDDSEQKAAVQMQHIADAVKHHDAAALKKLFSPRARENAADLDGGLTYFLSVFPSGKLTWKTKGTGLTGNTESFKRATELYGNYEVFANGEKYSLHFAYFPVNDFDPRNVGIYALGVAPRADFGYTASGAKKPFAVWVSQFGINETTHTATGDPGVYVPQN
jgi:hypothetical protein